MDNKEIDNRVSILVFDARAARKLLKAGYAIIDIKPNRANTEKTIFIFENTEEFKAALAEVMTELKTKDEATKEVVAE